MTSSVVAGWARLLLPLLLAPGCGGSATTTGDAGPLEPLRLLGSPESTAVKPTETREIVFSLLTTQDRPAPGQVIRFLILDDPARSDDDARGATLSIDQGTTDADGRVVLKILAGLTTTLRIRASAPRASDVEVVVFVDETTHGAAEVLPVLEEELPAERALATVKLHVFVKTPCAGLRGDRLPMSSVPVRTLPADTTAVYPALDPDGTHAIFGLGLDPAGRALAGGCVDLPGPSLLLQQTVRVVLPLHVYRPRPEGTFKVVSMLRMDPVPMPASQIASSWKELNECALDPARLWIDCTIDALSGQSATDPIDCRPGNEGLIGEKLNVRRGLPLAAGGNARCRNRMDEAQRPGIDALVSDLFPAGRPGLLGALPTLETQAGMLFEPMRVHSEIVITATSLPGRYELRHKLQRLEFPTATIPAGIDLGPLAAPVREARFISGLLRDGDLHVGTHGMTLRLGSAARLAFTETVLRPRGGPTEIPAFVTALFGLARRQDGAVVLTGCPALDSVLCETIGEPRGCVVTACAEGLAALAKRLDAGFVALDGDDLDLFLGGVVPLLDDDSDLQVDALGQRGGAPTSVPGLWSGELRAGGGASSPLSGTWTGERSGP